MNRCVRTLSRTGSLISRKGRPTLCTLFRGSGSCEGSVPGKSTKPVGGRFTLCYSVVSRANKVTAVTAVLTDGGVDVGGVKVVRGHRFRRKILHVRFCSRSSTGETSMLLRGCHCIVCRI